MYVVFLFLFFFFLCIVFQEVLNDSFTIKGDIEGQPIPDTTIPGAGYVSCDQASVCLEGGDRQYKIQGVVRAIRVPGSAKIVENTGMAGGMGHTMGTDVLFHTRTFEGMPDTPSEWGPDAVGGDGTNGLLGPAIVANPGDKVHVFVQNNLGDRNDLGPDIPNALDFW